MSSKISGRHTRRQKKIKGGYYGDPYMQPTCTTFQWLMGQCPPQYSGQPPCTTFQWLMGRCPPQVPQGSLLQYGGNFSQQMSPQQMLSQQMNPQQMLSQQMNPQQMLSQQMNPQQMLSQQMNPQQMLPQQMLPQQVPRMSPQMGNPMTNPFSLGGKLKKHGIKGGKTKKGGKTHKNKK
jgi:hypothetical protein